MFEVELPRKNENNFLGEPMDISMAMGTLKVQTISKYANFTPNKKGFYSHNGYEPKKCDLLIIDEISMLTQDHWNTIKNYGKNIILLGDPEHQLLPPGKAKRVNLDKIPSIELTEQMRQKDTKSSLYKLLTQLRNYEQPHHIEMDSSLQEVNSAEELMMAYHQCDSDSKTILSYMNERVDTFNKYYKTKILKKPLFEKGDMVVLQKSFERKRKTIFNNGEHVLIDFSYLGGKKGWIKGKNSDKTYETSFNPSILKHIYAQTITKSQGSTYDYVFIDMHMGNHLDEDEVRRLRYTAFGRARIKVVFFNSKAKKGKANA